MQLHLSPRHLKLTASIHEYAAKKILAIEDLAEIIAAHVVLIADETAKPKDRFCVKAHLAVPGPDIHAEDRDEDLYAALDKVAGKLARQLRKRHTAIIDKRRQRKQREREKSKRGI
ncbi:MAG TPA: ribosome-associated translation inhibitor RaiA [Verrucomicrobiaceae bacterium]|jgi:putative sigma-54 modulation protein